MPRTRGSRKVPETKADEIERLKKVVPFLDEEAKRARDPMRREQLSVTADALRDSLNAKIQVRAKVEKRARGIARGVSTLTPVSSRTVEGLIVQLTTKVYDDSPAS